LDASTSNPEEASAAHGRSHGGFAAWSIYLRWNCLFATSEVSPTMSAKSPSAKSASAKSHLSIAALAVAAFVAFGTTADAGIYEELQRSIRESETPEAEAPTLTRTQIVTSNGTFAVKGQRERKQVRMAAWYLSLNGDRLRIRQEMGHPTYRMLTLRSDVRTEVWTYPEHNRAYVFDGDTLIEQRLD
jgi:hypothetical protein